MRPIHRVARDADEQGSPAQFSSAHASAAAGGGGTAHGRRSRRAAAAAALLLLVAALTLAALLARTAPSRPRDPPFTHAKDGDVIPAVPPSSSRPVLFYFKSDAHERSFLQDAWTWADRISSSSGSSKKDGAGAATLADIAAWFGGVGEDEINVLNRVGSFALSRSTDSAFPHPDFGENANNDPLGLSMPAIDRPAPGDTLFQPAPLAADGRADAYTFIRPHVFASSAHWLGFADGATDNASWVHTWFRHLGLRAAPLLPAPVRPFSFNSVRAAHEDSSAEDSTEKLPRRRVPPALQLKSNPHSCGSGGSDAISSFEHRLDTVASVMTHADAMRLAAVASIWRQGAITVRNYGSALPANGGRPGIAAAAAADFISGADDAYRHEIAKLATAFATYDLNPAAHTTVPAYTVICIGQTDCGYLRHHIDKIHSFGVGYFVWLVNTNRADPAAAAANARYHREARIFADAFPGRFILLEPDEHVSAAGAWNRFIRLFFHATPTPLPFFVNGNGDFFPSADGFARYLRFVHRTIARKPRAHTIIKFKHYSLFTYTYNAWRLLGYFDESVYPAFSEDVEMVYRALSLGLHFDDYGAKAAGPGSAEGSEGSGSEFFHVGSSSMGHSATARLLQRWDRGAYIKQKWNVNMFEKGPDWENVDLTQLHPHPWNLSSVPHRSSYSVDRNHIACIRHGTGNGYSRWRWPWSWGGGGDESDSNRHENDGTTPGGGAPTLLMAGGRCFYDARVVQRLMPRGALVPERLAPCKRQWNVRSVLELVWGWTLPGGPYFVGML